MTANAIDRIADNDIYPSRAGALMAWLVRLVVSRSIAAVA
jgi:hypothetical protein